MQSSSSLVLITMCTLHTYTSYTNRRGINVQCIKRAPFQWLRCVLWRCISMLVNFMNGKTNYEKYHNLYLSRRTRKRTRVHIAIGFWKPAEAGKASRVSKWDIKWKRQQMLSLVTINAHTFHKLGENIIEMENARIFAVHQGTAAAAE